MKALFQEFVSPAQKRLLEVLAENGGVEGLRKNDNLKVLIKAENSVTKPSSQPNFKAKRRDANLELDDLRNDIFEDPNDAIENNWKVFNRKFEAQMNKIDELTRVVLEDRDRFIREVRGSASERIHDQVGF